MHKKSQAYVAQAEVSGILLGCMRMQSSTVCMHAPSSIDLTAFELIEGDVGRGVLGDACRHGPSDVGILPGARFSYQSQLPGEGLF